MRFTAASLLVFLAACPVKAAGRQPVALEPDASWMRLYSEKSPWAYYLEITKDGTVTARTESKKSVLTRRGRIQGRLIKDLFQEIESAQTFASQEINKGHLLFYKGEMIQISVYANGELRTFEALLSNLGAGFSHAFKLVRAEALKLKPVKEAGSFIAAEPLTRSDLDRMQRYLKNALVKVETSDITVKPLAKAIARPFRLIPADREQLEQLAEFISENNLKGIKNKFYLSTSRGDFRCSILDSRR